MPIWPAYSEAKARGDWAWIHRSLWRSMFVVAVLCVLPMAAATCYMRPIIRVWTGGKAELPTRGLLWLLFAWNALTVLQQPFGYLLAGLSEVRRATLYSVLSTVLALGVMFPLIPRFGVNALPLGLVIGFVPFIFCGNAVETWIVLRREARRKSERPETEAAAVLASSGSAA